MVTLLYRRPCILLALHRGGREGGGGGGGAGCYVLHAQHVMIVN